MWAFAALSGAGLALGVLAAAFGSPSATAVSYHSHAQHCRVSVELDGELELEGSDDGRDIPAQVRANVGLDSMRERAAELGGTCTIERGPAGGTRVRARIPMPEE